MSLLDGGNETVYVFVEEETTDSQENPIMAPSATGIPIRARVQPLDSDDDLSIGQQSEAEYRLRLDRRQEIPYGPWAAVEWRGDRYEVVGPPRVHSGSPRTSHVTAIIRR